MQNGSAPAPPSASAPLYLPQTTYQYQNLQTPSSNPPTYVFVPPTPVKKQQHHHDCDDDEHRVFVFEKNEYFTEHDMECVKGLSRGINASFRVCYKFFFIFMMLVGFVVAPFIGMAAGGFDAYITLYVRPFCRPIGKMMADLFGWSRASYFQYREVAAVKADAAKQV